MTPIEQLCFDLVCVRHPSDQPYGATALREAFHCIEDALDALQRAKCTLENTLAERSTLGSWFCPRWWRRKMVARYFLRDVALIQADLDKASNRLHRVASHSGASCDSSQARRAES